MSEAPNPVPIVSVVGRGGSGKTTFLEKLIRELADRGVVVATVKHHLHDFDADVVGKDSWRHAQAGATVAMVSSPEKLSLVQKLDSEMSLDELARIAQTAGADIMLTEGYKREGVNRVEIARREHGTELLTAPRDLLALVTDIPEAAEPGVRAFGLDDAAGVADLVQARFLSATGGR